MPKPIDTNTTAAPTPADAARPDWLADQWPWPVSTRIVGDREVAYRATGGDGTCRMLRWPWKYVALSRRLVSR